jgi:gamma-glutamyl:cysteine ligase YbdK (ATP-grasp superfamily)
MGIERTIIEGLKAVAHITSDLKYHSADDAFKAARHALEAGLIAVQEGDNAIWTETKDAAQRAAQHAKAIAALATKVAIDASALACIIHVHQENA